jgi:hypothetical protein
MVFLRGMVNAGSLVKNLTCTNTSPVLSNMAISSMFLKRDISQSGQQSSESKGLSRKSTFFLMYSYRSRSFWLCFLLISLVVLTSAKLNFHITCAAVAKKKPYSPFQNTSNMAEYAVARLDDLLNWGRKV